MGQRWRGWAKVNPTWSAVLVRRKKRKTSRHQIAKRGTDSRSTVGVRLSEWFKGRIHLLVKCQLQCSAAQRQIVLVTAYFSSWQLLLFVLPTYIFRYLCWSESEATFPVTSRSQPLLTSRGSHECLPNDEILQNTIHWPNAGLMLGRRRGRWANINPALGQCIVFSGIVLESIKIWCEHIVLVIMFGFKWRHQERVGV